MFFAKFATELHPEAKCKFLVGMGGVDEKARSLKAESMKPIFVLSVPKRNVNF